MFNFNKFRFLINLAPAATHAHLPPCQVQNVYSQPFAQACNLNGHHFMQPHTQITATPHHHQPHFQHLAQQVVKKTFAQIV